MAVNKVVYDGSTLIDLTGDTVSPETLAEGVTAHDKSGAPITGTMQAGSGGGDDQLTALIEGSIKEITNNATQIYSYKFNNTRSLTKAVFPSCTRVGERAFGYCTALSQVDIPICKQIDSVAFSGCHALKSINLPVCSSIGASAFENCNVMETASTPVCTYLGGYAFRYCSKLTSVNFPILSSTNSSAFYNCSALNLAIFGKLGTLSQNAFRACYSLSKLVLAGTSKTCYLANSNALSGTLIASGNGYIYVPSSFVDAYKSSTNWTYFSNQISAIEDSEFADLV